MTTTSPCSSDQPIWKAHYGIVDLGWTWGHIGGIHKQYPLVMPSIAVKNLPFYCECSHWKWWFSIVMSVYWRVNSEFVHSSQHFFQTRTAPKPPPTKMSHIGDLKVGEAGGGAPGEEESSRANLRCLGFAGSLGDPGFLDAKMLCISCGLWRYPLVLLVPVGWHRLCLVSSRLTNKFEGYWIKIRLSFFHHEFH